MIRGQQQIVPSFVPRPPCNRDGEDDHIGVDDDGGGGDDDELVNEAFYPCLSRHCGNLPPASDDGDSEHYVGDSDEND